MARLTTIEIDKERMKFSAGHFTIFSSTKREKLHGHNYHVYAAITTLVEDEHGITFDYRDYKEKLYAMCRELCQVFLLPGQSPHLKIEEAGEFIYAHFNDEKIPFLKEDVKILAISNVTLEELSRLFLEKMMAANDLAADRIQAITIKVFSSPGQCASSHWSVDA